MSTSINNIEETLKYQYPELQVILSNICEAIIADPGLGKDLAISLPENIQVRVPILKTNLQKELDEIMKGYKYFYEKSSTQYQKEFNELCSE